MSCLDPFCLASERVWNIWRLGKWSLSFPEALCLQKALLPGWRQQPGLPEMRLRKRRWWKTMPEEWTRQCFYLDYCIRMDMWKRNAKLRTPNTHNISFRVSLSTFSPRLLDKGSPLWSDSRIQARKRNLKEEGEVKSGRECVRFFANVFWRPFGLWNQTLHEKGEMR